MATTADHGRYARLTARPSPSDHYTLDETEQAMARHLEGMPLDTLKAAVPWGWESFGEYLAAFEGKVT